MYTPEAHRVRISEPGPGLVERARRMLSTRIGKITVASLGLAMFTSPLHAFESSIPDVPATIESYELPVVSQVAGVVSEKGRALGSGWKGVVFGYRYAEEGSSDDGMLSSDAWGADAAQESADDTGTKSQATSSRAMTVLRKMPEGTWLSGASDIDGRVADFVAYRGEPVTIAKSWSDKDRGCQETQCALGGYDSYKGSMDLSIGAFYEGESWEGAANGDYTERWRQALIKIREHRAGVDEDAVTFVNFAHEFNGDWYHWKVNSSNVAQFKKAWRVFYDLVQKELVDQGVKALVIWNPNNGNQGDVSMEEMWPGDDVVDVVGVDAYNGNGLEEVVDKASWDRVSNLGTIENPVGQETWRKFAEKHGKPLAFPEWGCDPKKLDDCGYFIQAFNDWVRRHAGSGPGQIVAETVFLSTDYKSPFWPADGLPGAREMYASLTWGS